MIAKILIANRGEIACRIIRTAKKLGIATVAVYSDADRDAEHVELAEEAVFIGPAPARESYLDGTKILDAARRSEADAIHPGYGFLAENADFAEACARAGVLFVGPSASAIRAMGDKARAKALVEKAGVPVLAGYHGDDRDLARLAEEAARIGYPVLIKPTAGGGGKGMKLAATREDFEAALASARREAAGAFDDDRVLLETYLTEPRHVEVQIFADAHGNVVHLFDRDCSIQRRHQKIIEEAPAPGLTDELRQAMREAAITAARSVGYIGAGTVEFLFSAARPGFYFLEMNTRLQVEHPVTEMITGLDLVEWQIRIAEGSPLPLWQEHIPSEGHAIEARLYAEDPSRDFLPQAGTLHYLAFPEPGARLRVDSGVGPGDAISPYYDPLIAKVIVHAEDRQAAIRAMRRALDSTRIAGVTTNRDFLRAIIANDSFECAALATNFVERHRDELFEEARPPSNAIFALAVIGLLCARETIAAARERTSSDPWSPWHRSDGWRLGHEAEEAISLREIKPPGTRDITVGVTFLSGGWRLAFPDGTTVAHASGKLDRDGRLRAELDGYEVEATFIEGEGEIFLIAPDGVEHRFTRAVHGLERSGPEPTEDTLLSPMPGRVAALLVEPGAVVEAGQPVLVIEAMKMEHLLRAPSAGRVEEFKYDLGAQVAEGALLVVFRALDT